MLEKDGEREREGGEERARVCGRASLTASGVHCAVEGGVHSEETKRAAKFSQAARRQKCAVHEYYRNNIKADYKGNK